MPYVGGIQSLAWPLRAGAWGACREWLDTGIGRRDFSLRELLLRAIPPSPTVQVSHVSALMHARNRIVVFVR